MQKIVFIHLFNDRSGSPKVLSQVIKACREKGIQTEVLTSAHKDGFLTECADRTSHLFYRRSENKIMTLIYYLISQIHLFFVCLKYLNQDVVFYVNTMMPFSAGVAGRLMGKEVIFHVHETSIKPKILKQTLRFFIEYTAHKVIFVSRYLKKKESFKSPEQLVIYNAIEKPDLEHEDIDPFEGKAFNVLMVCSLKEYKGVKEFISLSQNLCNLSFTLVLNADKSEVDEIFESWKVQSPSNLTVYPRQSNLNRFYMNASVVLNLSRPDGWIETFGLTIVEAMSFGKPVIVPPVGGPAEIITDSVDGYCISCYELQNIQDKLIELSANQTLYASMSKSAFRRSEDFTVEEFQKNILNVIQNKNEK